MDRCPVAEAAKVLGDKWTLLLLRDLATGARRFKDLERSVTGISPTMLASRLRELERRFKILQEEHALLKKAIRFASDQKRKSSSSSKQTGPNTESP